MSISISVLFRYGDTRKEGKKMSFRKGKRKEKKNKTKQNSTRKQLLIYCSYSRGWIGIADGRTDGWIDPFLHRTTFYFSFFPFFFSFSFSFIRFLCFLSWIHPGPLNHLANDFVLTHKSELKEELV